MSPRRTLRAVLALAGILAALPGAANAQPAADPSGPPPAPVRSDVISIQDICRVEGQGESVLRGIGLVTGLKGTGDAGSDEILARPLAQVYANNGIAVADLRNLSKAKAVALVWLEVVVPEHGARRDDKLDVFVTVMHSAASIEGGRLLVAPLTGPKKGDTTLWAMASGAIEIESKSAPTVGRIRGGARVVQDILPAALGTSFNLVLMPDVRGWTVSSQIAETINAFQPDTDPFNETGIAWKPIARAVDEATIRVEIPAPEVGNPARFLAKIMTGSFSPSLLRLPAQVLVNSRTGCIIVTGNVEISAVAIAHKDLVINTTNPPVPVALQTPQPVSHNSATVGTTARSIDRARIQDLLAALKTLDVPVDDQIAILTQIHRSGRLHARLVID